MPRITITNISSLPRRSQAICTVPLAVLDGFGKECMFVSDKGHKWRAVRTLDRGISHAVFRIAATMSGSESLEGELANQSHPDAEQPFKWHQWVSDDLTALVPSIGVVRSPDGQIVDWSQPVDRPLYLLEETQLHKRYMLVKREPNAGFTFVWFADIMHNDPAIRVWGFPIWSKRTDTATYRAFPALLLRSGEFIALDFAARLGIPTPVRRPDGWVSLLTGNITMKDGAGLPLSGHMLTLPSLPDAHIDTGDMSNDVALDLSSLKAAADGPIVAVSHDWDRHWLAHENVARFAPTSAPGIEEQLGEQAWQSFRNLLTIPGNFFTPRPLGLGLRPGATGDQEDFAASKGTFAVVNRDPRHIHAYNYSVMFEALRGFMHYEADGVTPLDLAQHPRWVTWNRETHFSTSVSPDRLGKTDPVFSNPTGVEGQDEEHTSENNLAAYYALSDDPRVPFMLKHQATTDLAAYRRRFPQNGGGAARAYGREAQCWANFVSVADKDLLPRLLQLIDSRWIAAANAVSFRDGLAMPVLGFHGPDGRKPIHADDGTTLIQTASIWEHGLALVGMYGAFKAGDHLRGHAFSQEGMLTKLCHLLAEFGCFLDTDGWWMVDDIAYYNGAAPPFALSKITIGPKLTFARGGTALWTLAGMLVACEWLPQGDPLRDKAVQCCNFFTQGREATDLRTSEWFAAVRSVIFP